MKDPASDLGLHEILEEHARSWPTATAVVDGDVRLTYQQLHQRVQRLVAVFGAHGVGPGDRVLWLGQNSFRLLELILAASATGAVVGPANWRLSAPEMASVLADAEPTLVVWQAAEVGPTVEQARAQWSGAATWLGHDDPSPAGYEAELAAMSSAAPEPSVLVANSLARASEFATRSVPLPGPAPVVVLYTAAFEGRPSGALLSGHALVQHALVLAWLRQVPTGFVYLNNGPLFHVGTLMFTMATFVLAGTNVFVARPDAATVCAAIEAERCQAAFLIDPIVADLVEANRDGRFDLTSLRSASFSPAWDAMVTLDDSPWGHHLGGYGQTEVAGMATFAALGVSAIGDHGRPSPLLQLRLVDADGREVPSGEPGEIVVRGGHVTAGYLRRPDLDATRRAGGWFHTNDLGRREADGSVTFLGPKQRMIKSANENIYPVEVEHGLVAHPAVAEAAVIGLPDERWGQRVLAVVVRVPGDEVTEDELIEHCRGLLASYKKPSAVHFVDELPRRGGLVDHAALDARFGGGGYPGSDSV